MLPGYQEVPPNCPVWKKAMIEKKNKQLEEDAMVELFSTSLIWMNYNDHIVRLLF